MGFFLKPSGGWPDKKLSRWDKGNHRQGFRPHEYCYRYILVNWLSCLSLLIVIGVFWSCFPSPLRNLKSDQCSPFADHLYFSFCLKSKSRASVVNGRVNPVVALNSALRFTPLEIMPRSVLSPAIAGLKFLTG